MLREPDWGLIRGCALFRALPDAELRALIDSRALLTLAKGDEIFQQGEPARAFYLVLEGQVKLTRLGINGEEAVVHVFSQGDSFAEAAMFMGARYPVSASAIAPTRVIGISNAAIRARIIANPDVAFSMLASMSQHYKVLVDQIEAMKLMTGDERVARFLLDHAPASKGAVTFALPHEKTLIANRLGMKPETFSRALARLRTLGVDVSGNHVAIENIGRLAAWSNGEI